MFGLNCDELKTRGLWVQCAAEFLATTAFVFLVCGSTLGVLDIVRVAFTAGLSIATLVLCIGHLTGGLINPSVAVALMVTRKLGVVTGVLYVVGELLGAITGAALLYSLIPANNRGSLGVTAPAAHVSAAQAFGMESFLTFLLILTIFAVTDPARQHRGYEIPLAIGVAITICHLVGIPYTGSSLNPARSFGPAVIMNSWKLHWVYWTGPFFGSIIAAFLYDCVFAGNKNQVDSPEDEETLFPLTD